MNRDDPQSVMFGILALREEINRVSSRLIKHDNGVFEEISLPIPKFKPSELGFLRTVSWLYVLYIEAGRVSVPFLTARFAAYGLDVDDRSTAHLNLIQKMRTYLQHNLAPSEPSNKQAQEECEKWFLEYCGTPIPGTDSQWQKCLDHLLLDSHALCENFLVCIRRIEEDDSRDQIAREWDLRIRRYHPPHEYDRLIEITAGDMGKEHLDVVRLRKRFYDRWVKDLNSLDDEYDFDVEARKLIEQVLLLETTPVLPITGKDIIEIFAIEPGPQIGAWLQRARILYQEEPCSRNRLLERLREHEQQQNPLNTVNASCEIS